MVWYFKYQFRYIIGLWSQKWEKNVRFLTLATFILWKIILLEGDIAYLGASWLCPTNNRGEPHEILVKCFKNFVYPSFVRRKKKANSERYFKTFYSSVNLRTVLFMFFLQPEEKAKLKRPAYRSNEFQFF